MEAILKLVQGLDLHPVVDHFTVALLIIAVLTDLVGSLLPTYKWIRYMALTLMVLGAIAAAASFETGSLEANRVWKHISPDAQHVLHLHAEFGKYLAITFGVLAVWRIFLGFVAGSRPLYLLIAVLACAALLYAVSLGGELVYNYGVGTALMSPAAPGAEASPAASPTPEVPTSALPTVSVPTPTPTPPAPASPSPSPAAAPKPTESPAAPAPPSPHAVPTTGAWHGSKTKRAAGETVSM